MILCDAGVLLCLVDRTQPQHKAYKSSVLRLAKPLVTNLALPYRSYVPCPASWRMANAKTVGAAFTR
ncbi:MAG: hypothetical protein RLZZ597_3496 [Cyanobacteriota bacterium]|jgi:hypothetical protein